MARWKFQPSVLKITKLSTHLDFLIKQIRIISFFPQVSRSAARSMLTILRQEECHFQAPESYWGCQILLSGDL
jgi:hypothetical protein